MPIIEYKAQLDFTDNGVFETGWRIKQGDYGSCQLVFLVTNNGENQFDVGITPQIGFRRADGMSIVSELTPEDPFYTYTFVGNELEIPGPTLVDVKYVYVDGRISTATCRFDVVPDTIGYDPTGAGTYNNPVSALAEMALAKAAQAEAYAVGTRNGTPVDSGDPTYDNNAKYYYEETFAILPKVFDNEPYVLRQSKGHAVDLELVGGSLAWNQLVQNSDSSVTVPNGRKYIRWNGSALSKATSDGTAISVTGGTDKIYDVTQMFGSTIADAITTDAFAKYFPKYKTYAYDSGSIQSVCVSARKVVGKNQYNKSAQNTSNGFIQNKYLTNTGSIENSANDDISEYIKVVPNTSYVLSGVYGNSASYCLYDGNKTFISGTAYSGQTTVTFNSQSAEYVRFTVHHGNENAVQFEFGSAKTDYEPFKQTTYPLPTTQLQGIPTLVDGKLAFDGDVLKSSGSGSAKYKLYHLYDYTWTYVSGTPSYFHTNLVDNKVGATGTYGNILPSNGYKVLQTKGSTAETMSEDKGIALQNGSHLVIVRDSAYTDATAFKNAMNGVYLVAELATPTAISASPFQNPQRADANGTEEFVDYGVEQSTRDVAIPCGHNSEYFVDNVVNYSTSEQDTGMKWINGKHIFQKTLDFGSSGISVSANGTAATSELKTGKEQLISSSAITQDGKVVPYIGCSIGSTYIMMENKTGNATTVRYFTFQYTKS